MTTEYRHWDIPVETGQVCLITVRADITVGIVSSDVFVQLSLQRAKMKYNRHTAPSQNTILSIYRLILLSLHSSELSLSLSLLLRSRRAQQS